MSVVEVSYSAGGSLISIAFDATIREQHISTSIVTEHPVEKGANVSDHVRPELDKLSVDVFVTNTPIHLPTTNMAGVGGRVSPLDLTVPVKNQLPIAVPGVGAILAGAGVLDSTITQRVQVLQFDSEFDRVRDIYDALRTLEESATLVSVFTSLREYDNMIIKSLSAPRTVQDGNAITFTFEAQAIRFVETKRVPAPKTKTTAPTKKNKGAVAPVPAEKESLLHKLLN